jgi:hypothetical protein
MGMSSGGTDTAGIAHVLFRNELSHTDFTTGLSVVVFLMVELSVTSSTVGAELPLTVFSSFGVDVALDEAIAQVRKLAAESIAERRVMLHRFFMNDGLRLRLG